MLALYTSQANKDVQQTVDAFNRKRRKRCREKVPGPICLDGAAAKKRQSSLNLSAAPFFRFSAIFEKPRRQWCGTSQTSRLSILVELPQVHLLYTLPAMKWDDALAKVEHDGLKTPEVGPWAEEKHRLLAHYASLFVRSMQGKWDDLVYLDLFAGPGRCVVRGTSRHYRSSPTVVLNLPEAFSFYVFCDADARNVHALEQRTARDAPGRHVTLLSGDANELCEKILAAIPKGGKSRKVLSFCFLDPFQLRNLHFETIRHLATRFVDFLVLIPSGMDANRNEHNYTRVDNNVMDMFLGNTSWRERWRAETAIEKSFEQFTVREFGASMEELNHIDPGIENSAVIRSQDRNLLLYRLILYSRHKLGSTFWNETRKYADPQIGLDF